MLNFESASGIKRPDDSLKFGLLVNVRVRNLIHMLDRRELNYD